MQTFGEFRKYIHFCMDLNRENNAPQCPKWNEMNKKGHVSLSNMNAAYVQNQTRGTGYGVALHANKNPDDETKVMISHAWQEDMVQVLEILESARGTELKDGSRFGDDTLIWFCAFAQYQPNDNLGPKVSEQVALGPFEPVIESVKDMFIIQTATCDPYTRMWCAIELGEAILKQNKGELKIHPFFSQKWLNTYVQQGELVNPTSRVCSNGTYYDLRDKSRNDNENEAYFLMNADDKCTDKYTWKDDVTYKDKDGKYVTKRKDVEYTEYNVPKLKSLIRKVSALFSSCHRCIHMYYLLSYIFFFIRGLQVESLKLQEQAI